MISADSELIARSLASDDRDAFGQLVQRHQSAVRNFLRHLTRGDAALADDLAQETFLHAWRGLGRFRGDAAFSTWLLGIAHNQWRNARRRDQRSVLRDAVEDEPLQAASDCAREVDLHSDLTAALSHLPAHERLALHLSYQQGLSHGEVAALLEWPIGTVKTHLARGKEKLRTLLSAWNPQT